LDAPQAAIVVAGSALVTENEVGDGFAMHFIPFILTFSHRREGTLARYVTGNCGMHWIRLQFPRQMKGTLSHQPGAAQVMRTLHSSGAGLRDTVQLRSLAFQVNSALPLPRTSAERGALSA
jgi:hypothetical protein